MTYTVDKTFIESLDHDRFPVDEWRLIETEPRIEDIGVTETLFSIGNGYLGMRDNPSSGTPSYQHGTFINGFHETWTIRHAEEAYGFARTGQTIVNVPDSKIMKIYVDDEPLSIHDSDFEAYEKSLNFKDGTYHENTVWRTPSGKRVQVKTTRMISFTDRHLALFTLEIVMLDGDAPIVISSQILNRQDGFDNSRTASEQYEDPRKSAKLSHRVLEPQKHWRSDRRMIIGFRTANSKMTLAVGADHEITTNNNYESLISIEPDEGKRVYRIEAKQGVTIKITKSVAYHTSTDCPVRELFDRCRRTLDRVREHGLDYFFQRQHDWMDDYWQSCDVEIINKPEIQQAVRWALFQLAQASARCDQLGIPAKGVTGNGYEGHYFWDTETYIVPFLSFTNPRLARNVLRFRYNTLPKAQERARQLSEFGALFPWRTINGEEASAYYAAGTAQYHIDADIAYAFNKYYEVTGDKDFMLREGATVLAETARMWADLGFWRETTEGKSFHIHRVTGPDEYTTVVNNNMFTNVMARNNLNNAVRIMHLMKTTYPHNYSWLIKHINLTETEIQNWQKCADGMYIPFDESAGIHPQDDQFLTSQLWDLENTPPEKRPLLLHYHPLVIYRFQVIKQADVVLALLLQGDQFNPAQKRADFEYYDPITTGDSTLSAVAQSIIAAEVGYQDMAMNYFLSALFLDLANLHGNTCDGVHAASTGGVWSSLVYGFAGMREYHGNISFDPRLPVTWEGLKFPILVRGSKIKVELSATQIKFTLESGRPLEVFVRGHKIVVSETVTVALKGQGLRLPSLTGTHPIVGGRREDGSLITAEVPETPEDTDIENTVSIITESE